MSHTSSTSARQTSAAEYDRIAPTDDLFDRVLTALEEFGLGDVTAESPKEDKDQLAHEFQQHVIQNIPQLARQVRHDDTVYTNAVDFLLNMESALVDDEDTDEEDDDDEYSQVDED